MIDPRELRIGNWITAYGAETNVLGIIGNWITTTACAEKEGLYFENAIPIPLTPEWLERFGFEKKTWGGGLGKYFEQDEFQVYIISKGYEIEFTPNGKDTERFNLYRTYQFVHQLQNIVHALTGKELTLKDKQ